MGSNTKFVINIMSKKVINHGQQKTLRGVYFKQAFDNNPTAMITADMDGHITAWNSAAEKLFGYKREEVLGVHIDDIVANHESIRQEALEYTKAIRSGKRKIIRALTKRTHKTGKLIDVDFSGILISEDKNTVGFLGVYHDISTIKRTENDLRRLKEYYEALFRNSPAAIISVDSNVDIVSWNPMAEQLFGYSKEEAIGKNLDSMVANNPDIRAEAEGYSQQAFSELFQATSMRTHKSGKLIEVEILALPVEIDEDNQGFIVIYHDISKLEAARRLAEEANRAKSDFLARMSHELRTPLNAIIGFTRIIKRKSSESLPSVQVDNLDRVLISAEHLLNLINDVLDISKIEAGKMIVEPSFFNIEPLIDICLHLSEPLINDKQIKLEKSIPDNLPKIFSDQEKIKQILLNLLSNAAKFTNEGSIKIVAEKKKENLVISVADSGIGIEDEALSRIFEEFQQADMSTTRKYGGTGLGLSISSKLAVLLGGELSVDSKIGVGSTFTLTIPISYTNNSRS